MALIDGHKPIRVSLLHINLLPTMNNGVPSFKSSFKFEETRFKVTQLHI